MQPKRAKAVLVGQGAATPQPYSRDGRGDVGD